MTQTHEHPFYDDPWVGDQADAAAAIWDWHSALHRKALAAPDLEVEDFQLEAERVRVEMTTRLLEESVQERARSAVSRWSLDPNLFAIQMEAAVVFTGPTSFADKQELLAFVDRWAASLGRLLISVAGSNREWQIPWVDALSRGFFLLGRMLALPSDAVRGQVFFPQDEMEFFGVTLSELTSAPPSDDVRKLLWKQCVRIRDQFAQALPLAEELPRKQAAGFRRWWLGGLEMVNTIERKDYDVWSEPITLSPFHRAQVRYQSRFGRLTFKRK